MKPPYVKLYVKDFAFEIQGMTKKQIGEYMLKFLESYRQESIPDEFSKHSLFSELQNSFQNYAETCEKNRKNIKKRYSKKNIDNTSESNTYAYQSYENGKPVEYLTNNQEPITNNQEKPLLAAKAARRQRLPDDFFPDQTGITKATESGITVASELERFKDYHRGKGTTMLDWQAAWRTWVNNAVKFGAKNGHSNRDRERAETLAILTGRTGTTYEAG